MKSGVFNGPIEVNDKSFFIAEDQNKLYIVPASKLGIPKAVGDYKLSNEDKFNLANKIDEVEFDATLKDGKAVHMTLKREGKSVKYSVDSIIDQDLKKFMTEGIILTPDDQEHKANLSAENKMKLSMNHRKSKSRHR